MKIQKLSMTVLLSTLGLFVVGCSSSAQQLPVMSVLNPEEEGVVDGSTATEIIASGDNNPMKDNSNKQKEEAEKKAKEEEKKKQEEAKNQQDSTPKCVSGKGYYKVGDAYQQDGIWYYPNEDYSYVEEGMASWYGPGFHDKLTSNGEVFDTMTLTAAHRTLPMPSIVRVTNLENGISIVVKVNDRGPFARDRIIDLSQHAAELLKMKDKGSALVRVEVLEEASKKVKEMALNCQPTDFKNPQIEVRNVDKPEPTPTPAPVQEPEKKQEIKEPKPILSKGDEPADNSNAVKLNEQKAKELPEMSDVLNDEYPFYVQAGAFVSETGAQKVRDQLRSNGVNAHVVKRTTGGETWYKVRVGSFKTKDDAKKVQERVNSVIEDSDSRVIEKQEDDTNMYKWS